MPTCLQTRLLPIGDQGEYLLVTLGTDDDRPDTRCAIAKTGRLGSDEAMILTDRFTLPRPASEREALRFEESARGQQEVAESDDHASYRRYYLENAAQYSLAAAIARTEQRWLPEQIAVSGRGAVTVRIGYQNGEDGHGIAVREIDARSGSLKSHNEFAGAGDDHDNYMQLRRLHCMDPDTGALLVSELLKSRTVGLHEKQLQDGLPLIASYTCPKDDEPQYFAHAAGRWAVAAYNPNRRGTMLRIIDQGTGELQHEIALSSDVGGIGMTEDGSRVACAVAGGRVWLVDLESGKIRKFAPHIGAGRDTWCELYLAASGDFIVSVTYEGHAMITWLGDGRSASLGKLSDATRIEAPFGDLESIVRIRPALAVLGERIAVAEDLEVRELSASADDYDDAFVSEAGRKGARKPVRVSKKAPFAENIEKARLAAHSDRIQALASPAVAVHTKKLGKRGWSAPDVRHAPELGASRFGGWPDLAAGSSWPTHDGRPMAFLGQIDLSAAAEIQPDLRLPRGGLLSFFLGCQEGTYTPEEDARERYLVDIEQVDVAAANWAVIHAPADTALERIVYKDSPLPELFNPAAIRLAAGTRWLPDEESCAFDALALTPFERADYLEMASQLQRAHEGHQLMGYPTLIQPLPPELYCAAGGLDTPEDRSSEEYDALAVQAADWLLLLQLTEDQYTDFTWGDGGRFYFYIHRDDLAAGDFSKTRVYFEN